LWRESLEIAKETKFAEGQAKTELAMAKALLQRGERDEALRLLESARRASESTADAGVRAHTLHEIAVELKRTGCRDKALDLWGKILEICERVGDVYLEAAVLNFLAIEAKDGGRDSEALELWARAIAICDESGNLGQKAAILKDSAELVEMKGDIDGAVSRYRSAIEMAAACGDRGQQASALTRLADLLLRCGRDTSEAMSLLSSAAPLYESMGDVDGAASVESNMARLLAMKGQSEQAILLWKKAIQAFESTGHIQGQAAALAELGATIRDCGDPSTGLNLLRRSWDLHGRTGNIRGKALTEHDLGVTLLENGSPQEGYQFLLSSARHLASICSYTDLPLVLTSLCAADKSNGARWIAQAVLIALKISLPDNTVIAAYEDCFQVVPHGHRLERNLAFLACRESMRQMGPAAMSEPIPKDRLKMLEIAAHGAGISDYDSFVAWSRALFSRGEELAKNEVEDDIRDLVGADWLFEPNRLKTTG
jgi:tetratricopeptide (TPR) repeat protein